MGQKTVTKVNRCHFGDALQHPLLARAVSLGLKRSNHYPLVHVLAQLFSKGSRDSWADVPTHFGVVQCIAG
jgi:hypothetical protein